MTSKTATRARLRWMLLVALASAIALVAAATAVGLDRSTTSSTQAVKTGVVTVNVRFTTGGAGAGTGIVLTSSGEVLTNNHVIRGAQSIRVTVPSTGRTYSATVGGYSIARDVALLDLQGARGLSTAALGDSSDLRLGDSIVTVGNAGGTGALTVKSGRVVRLNRSITVRDDDGTPARLSGLIETTAPLQPGDSGGPLLLNGEVVGMDAAASSTLSFRTTGGEGYSIPINTVFRIAQQIEAGHRTSNVHVGPTAFLGVSLADTDGFESSTAGAVVHGVSPGSPAAKVGLGSGDVITSVAGRGVRTAAALRALIVRLTPGQLVRVIWVDPSGGETSARVRLASGPPQ